MESWEKERIEELKKIVAGFLSQKSELKKQLKTEPNEKKPEILEKILKICDELKANYRILEISSKIDYSTELRNNLKDQIEYYEQELKILKEKVKEEEIRFDYFLRLARFQYEYFDLNREEIISKAKAHKGGFAGVSFIPAPEVDTIISSIRQAMHNVQEVIREKKQTMDYNTLFMYYELYGDFFITIYALETEIEEFSAFAEIYNIDYAFECYEKASDYKSKMQLPSIYLDGLHGVGHVKPFYNFFEDIDGNIHDVDHKKNHVYKKFENHLNLKTKSFCWKTGQYCTYKRDVIYTLEEGNGVFVSMNYSNDKNYKLLSYIEKVLNYFNLKAILKRNRIRSPSWTKEICCTIYNNKYALVLLDKYSPNVVLELGVSFGMGRKTIILVNEVKGGTEQKLFSMIKDYDCVTYKNVNDLYESLIHSINGVFFNFVDYSVPEISNIFNEVEVTELNNLIKSYSD